MVSKFGDKYKLTSKISEDEEIVISGLSGRYPNSANVAEFAHNLYNKVFNYKVHKKQNWYN